MNDGIETAITPSGFRKNALATEPSPHGSSRIYLSYLCQNRANISPIFLSLIRPLEPHGRNQRHQRNHPTRHPKSTGSRLRTDESEVDAPVNGKGQAGEDIDEEEKDEEVVKPEAFFEVETPCFRWIRVIRQELFAEFSWGTQEDVRGARAFFQ